MSRDDEVAEVADRLAIRDTLARVARGCDRVDADAIEHCYAEDSIDKHGPLYGSGREFAARPERPAASNVRSHHLLGQSIIELSGNDAVAETYFIAHDIFDGDGPRVAREYFGRYLDQLTRTERGWKVRMREVVIDWGHERPATDLWTGAEDYTRGQRAPDDPSYALLAGRAHSKTLLT